MEDIFTYKEKQRYSSLKKAPRKVSKSVFAVFSYKFFIPALISAIISLLYAFVIPYKFEYNVLLFYIIVIINLGFLSYSVFKSIITYKLLKYGCITFAKLKDLKETKLPGKKRNNVLYTFTFVYKNGEKENHIKFKTRNRLGIGDEINEPVMYNPSGAGQAYLVDRFNFDLKTSGNGEWEVTKGKKYFTYLAIILTGLILCYSFFTLTALQNYSL